MLNNTFIHLPGIGAKKERELWNEGILTWDDFERNRIRQWRLFDDGRDKDQASILAASREALESGDIDFFADHLPKREHYRIALTVPEQTAFLDIETTGLSHYYDETTVIGFSIGDEYNAFIEGSDWEAFKDSLSRARCLVTFNGTIFDLKFIEKEFPDLRLPKAHIDLRFFAKRAGFSGGQKAIEEELGINRAKDIKGMKGENAPILWHQYRMGDAKAARLLLEYNHADVDGMKGIFDRSLEKVLDKERISLMTNLGKPFSEYETTIRFAKSPENVAKNRIYVPPSPHKPGPRIIYRKLARKIGRKPLRVVGIDITSSETRASGWCFLDGSRAYTNRVFSDSEIFSETINVEPDIVSIDSPLSLPKGRTKVTDDDPGREEFGIVRECERVLFRRGVSVYPCLIQSMQKLTERGIRLASHFRAIGIPVIESYPGAAQDIMDIPRKKAGLEYLAKGLADFGLKGDFVSNKVSHDELDAITSAIVGLFFWSGKYEALGDEVEDYLIIPDLKGRTNGWRKRKVVGFSGPIAAGKTTGARYLEQSRSFSYGRFSQVLETMLKSQRRKPTRKNLQEIGEHVHEEFGQRWLCKQLANALPKDGDLAIDGLRFPEDHAYLVERFGPAFIHLHIEADESIRKNRYKKMGNRVRDFQNASIHVVESNVNRLAQLAHHRISNDGTLKGLTSKLRRVITA